MKRISLFLVSVMAMLSFSLTSCEKEPEPYDNSALTNTVWEVAISGELKSVIEFTDARARISEKGINNNQTIRYQEGRYELRDTNVKFSFNEAWNYDADVANALPLTATLEGVTLFYNNLEYKKVK